MNYSAKDVAEAVKKAKRVYVIGNGGSYANAVHIVNDLIAAGVKAFCLDPATLTAEANDYSYESVFSHWLDVVGEEGDLLIALSGSGKSKNIVQALRMAAVKGMDYILVTDYLKTLNMQESEEDQVRLGHDVARLIRDER